MLEIFEKMVISEKKEDPMLRVRRPKKAPPSGHPPFGLFSEAEAEALTVAGTDGGRGRPLCTLGDQPTASPPGPSGPPIGVGGDSLSARARLEALRNELMLELTWARQAAASRRQYLQIKKSLLV